MIVTLDEIKAHLRIDTDEENDYLDDLIEQAEAACLDFCLIGAFPDPHPLPAKRAVMLFAGHLYANRDGADPSGQKALMSAVHNLLWPYRDVSKLV